MEDALAAIGGAGFRDVDLMAIGRWAHFNPAELAADYGGVVGRVEAALSGNGLTMRAMNIGMNAQMHDRRRESVEANLRELGALCKLMRYFGVGHCALQPLQKDASRPAADVLRDSVDSLEEYYGCASRHGVSLGLELHNNSPFETVEAARYVYERIPEATIVFDPTHFIMDGLTLQDSEFVMGKAVHCHIRDAGPGMIQARLGEGTVDFAWIVRRFNELGYEGHLSIEYLHNDEWDALAEAVRLKALLEGLLAG